MSSFSKYYRQDLKNFLKSTIPANHTAKTILDKSHLTGNIKNFEYLVLPNTFSNLDDIQSFLTKLKGNCSDDAKIIVIYFNFLWKPILDLASLLTLRQKDSREPNWLSSDDIHNLFHLEGFMEVKKGKRFLLPIPVPFLSDFVNKYLAQIPIINSLCLTTFQIFKPIKPQKEYSVSIIIPARNEAGNMTGVLKKIPRFTNDMEVIFVEGHSNDQTFKVIQNEISSDNSGVKSYLIKQKGIGKGDAVREGFKKSTKEILMILDADLTVRPIELSKFYQALSKGYCDFANGSRLVYPLEEDAMRTLNYFGNKIFGVFFSYILGQKIKDTLCGTKVLFREDYIKIAQNRKYFGNFDPFGDFDLLFGASRLNLKIIDIPIRYRERVYGSTNISRFRHGLLLLKMTLFGARKLKFI